MDRIPEDSVRCLDTRAAKSLNLAFTGRDGHQIAGNTLLDHAYPRRQYARCGNTEALHAFLDYPVVGRADGPNVGAFFLQLCDQRTHFRKNMRLDMQAEVI